MQRITSLVKYVSDLHLEKGFKRIIVPDKPLLILAGDIGYPEQESYKNFLLSTSDDFDKVFVVSGNHEYDNKHVDEFKNVDEKIENICNMRNNLFFLQKKSYSICNEHKINITGCTLWAEKPTSRYKYHLNHKEWLSGEIDKNTRKHLIVTHHCPYNKVGKKEFKYFGTDQSYILKKNNVVCWIYGHTHYNKNINLEGKPVITNQYGSYQNPLYGYK